MGYLNVENGNVAMFSEKSILSGALLFGPLAAVFCMYQNFKDMHKHLLAKMTMLVGTTATLVLYWFGYILPENIAGLLFTNIVGAGTYQVVKKYQKSSIDTHFSNGGRKRPWYHVLLVGTVGALIPLSIGFGVDHYFGVDEPVTHGTPMHFNKSGCTIFYDKSNIDKSEVEHLGALLHEFGFFVRSVPSFAGLYAREQNRIISLFIYEHYWNDQTTKNKLSEIIRIMSAFNKGKSYQIELVNYDSENNRNSLILSE